MRTAITVVIVSLLMMVAWLTSSWGIVGVAVVFVGMAGYVAGYHDGWNAAVEEGRMPASPGSRSHALKSTSPKTTTGA